MNSRAAFRITIEFPPEEYAKHTFLQDLVKYRDFQLRHSQHNSSLIKNVSARGLSTERERLMRTFGACINEDIPVFIRITDYQGQRVTMDAFQFTDEGVPTWFTFGMKGIYSSPEAGVPLCSDWEQIIKYRDTFRTLQLLKESS